MVLSGPDAVTTDEMIANIAAALDHRAPRVRVPLTPLLWTATVLETTLRPLGIQPPLHRRRMNFFIKSFDFTCATAREHLNYRPVVDFAEGARRTAAWYREQDLL